MNISEQIAHYKANPSKAEEMFRDWFCRDSSLAKKALDLLAKLADIADSPRFDKNKTFAFFKNNCPGSGSLYDDIRICDLRTREVLFCVIPKSGHKAEFGKAEVYGHKDRFKQPLVSGTWTDIVKWSNCCNPSTRTMPRENTV